MQELSAEDVNHKESYIHECELTLIADNLAKSSGQHWS